MSSYALLFPCLCDYYNTLAIENILRNAFKIIKIERTSQTTLNYCVTCEADIFISRKSKIRKAFSIDHITYIFLGPQ
jgi:hypothetical protein